MPEGGLVPKNLYITSSDEDVDKERNDEALLGPDAIYHTAYAVKDFPHEVQLVALCCVSSHFHTSQSHQLIRSIKHGSYK